MPLRIQKISKNWFLPLKQIPSRGKDETYAQIAKTNSRKCHKTVISEGHGGGGGGETRARIPSL